MYSKLHNFSRESYLKFPNNLQFPINTAIQNYYNYVNIGGGPYSISQRFMLVYFVI